MDEKQKMPSSLGIRIGKDAGFTLVELLLVVAISSVVLTGIYSVFRAQQKASATNTQVVMMQQNMRAAMALMEWDIRMAGYSPSGNDTLDCSSCAGGKIDVGFVAAREGLMEVVMDLNDDGNLDSGEDVAYGFRSTDDSDRDGRLDSLAVDFLRRDTGGGMQPMANNIQAFAFAYAFDNDQDGELDTSGGNVIWAVDSDGGGDLDLNVDTGAALGTPVNFNRIQAVRITLLARSENAIHNYQDNRSYQVGRYTIPGGGQGFLHRTLETVIKCRNMNS